MPQFDRENLKSIKYQITTNSKHNRNLERFMFFREDISILDLVSKLERVGKPIGLEVVKIKVEGKFVYEQVL